MPRKKLGPDRPAADVNKDLADKLAAELKSSRDFGQPVIYEHTFRTGKATVTVVWDAWDSIPLQQRSATILRAYETAEEPESRERIALASGLTVPEAHAAGMLPYQIITALRKSDPMTPEAVRQAMLDEGGSLLYHWNPERVQLRFATPEEAEAARQRLIQRLPKSDEVWIVDREITAQDLATAQD
ncbi:MAG: hypothetical protein K2R98_33205 [Gemmataceae bacterium]|nr:hypothetical protein [Gemmataceae bacterium]